MKFLFALFLTLTTAAYVQFGPPEIIPILGITSQIRSSHKAFGPLIRQGNNFDNCTTQDECNSPRLCLSANSNGGPTPCMPDEVCQCAPTEGLFCEESSDCADGESCATSPGAPRPVCASDIFIIESDGAFTVVDGPNPTAPPTTAPSTTAPPATQTVAPDPTPDPGEPPLPPVTSPEVPTIPTRPTGPAVTPEVEPTTTPEPAATAPPTGTVPPSAAPVDSETVDPTTPVSGEDDDDEVCFPGTAVVHLANGEKIRMGELRAGHAVQHDEFGSSSKVFLFTHRTSTPTTWFYQITTESGHSVTMTGRHYLYANGRLTSADAVKRGDLLRTVDGDSHVTRIRRVRAQGLYAPHSLHGDLVVGGIVVSGYSRAVSPALAHALLAPVRWFVRKTGVLEPLGSVFYGGGRGVEKIMVKGASRY